MRIIMCVSLFLASSACAEIQCPTGPVGPADRVHIALPAGHGPELAIVTPRGRFFFFGGRDYPDLPERPPLSEAEARALPALDFEVGSLRMRPFEWGASEQERVFVEAGRYEVRVSENLQTNDGTPVDRCSIVYAPEEEG